MNVGIDTFGLDHGRSGLGAYLLSLLPSFPKAEDIRFELFGPEMDRYTYTDGNGFDFARVSVPDSITAERLWHVFNLNNFAKKRSYDVILYSAGARMLPRKSKVPGLVVVNDILSTLIANSDDFWLKKNGKNSLMNASCIVASSQFIKKDLEKAGLKDKRIEVIHNGIDHSHFFPDASFNGEVVDIKPFAIKRPYLLYPSRMNGLEKKHVELIKAFTLFKEKTHLPHRLVIAGSEGSSSEAVHKAAFASPYASDIFITGYFPHENFPQLYRASDAVVFPSVNEGVGLPVLEAMATGIPVTCSKSGALTEVAGSHALFFDSDNIEEIASSMERILTDQKLRAELVEGGIEWANHFSWEKTASEILKLIRELK